MDSIIKRVLKDEWPSIQKDVEQMAANKVKDRIEIAKHAVLANLNGIEVDKMKEILSTKKEEPVAIAA